jgi:hypothetical protein
MNAFDCPAYDSVNFNSIVKFMDFPERHLSVIIFNFELWGMQSDVYVSGGARQVCMLVKFIAQFTCSSRALTPEPWLRQYNVTESQ